MYYGNGDNGSGGYNGYDRNGGYNGYNMPGNSYADRAGLGLFTSRVFGWMFLGLFATAAAAFLTASSATLLNYIFGNPIVYIVLIFAELGLVMYLSARITKMQYQTAVMMFLLYSLLNGVTLSVILLVYTASSVAYTFAITSVTFGVMSIYGFVTKTDLTRIGHMLFMGLIGLIVLSLVNFFVNASALEWFISILGIFVFLGLTAYDTQKIKQYYYGTAGNTELAGKVAIMGALRLYLDFINLFLMLLRLFGKRR